MVRGSVYARKVDPATRALIERIQAEAGKPVARKKAPRSKFHNVKTVFRGTTYDSKGEAEEAAYLDKQIELGLVSRVERQVRVVLEEHPRLVYVADWEVWPTRRNPHYQVTGGEPYLADFKGVLTPTFRMKLRFLKARHPGRKLLIVQMVGRGRNRHREEWWA